MSAMGKSDAFVDGTSYRHSGILTATKGAYTTASGMNGAAVNDQIFGNFINVDATHRHQYTASGYLYGKTDTTGSGTAVNKMPPYIVKYCWERTA
jgi:hypothetical protein